MRNAHIGLGERRGKKASTSFKTQTQTQMSGKSHHHHHHGHHHHRRREQEEEKTLVGPQAECPIIPCIPKPPCVLSETPCAQLVAQVPALEVLISVAVLGNIFTGLNLVSSPLPNFPSVISVTGAGFQLHCPGYYQVSWEVPVTVAVAVAGIGIAINGTLDPLSLAAPLVAVATQLTNTYIFAVTAPATVQLVNGSVVALVGLGTLLDATTANFNIVRLSGLPSSASPPLCAPCQ